MQNIVDYIKKRRKELKYTQEYVANRLNISVRTYQTMEYGSISLKELGELASVLNFRVQLIGNENIMFEAK